MGRLLWAWGLFLLFLVGFAATAQAEEIHVCIRPPNISDEVLRWAYTSDAKILGKWRKDDFTDRSRGLTVYVFDPGASSDSPKLLPIPYNQLTCAPRPKPIEASGPPPPAVPAGEKKKNDGGSPGGTDKPKDPKTGENLPSPPPAPIVYPKKEPEPIPKPPENGITTHWPATVLSIVKRSKNPAAPAEKSEGSSANGSGTKKGVEKTPFEKFAEEMAFAGAIANQQFNAETKGAGGQRYGIPGGKNANGPNSPVAQASAGAALVVVAVLAAGGFEKKLKDAIQGKAAVIIKDTGTAGEKAAEKLIQDYVSKGGAQVTAKTAAKRLDNLVDAMHKSGAIGEYAVMKKFTDGMKGSVQAHHILEKSMVEKFGLGNADRVPSVILTDAEHKLVTAALAKKTPAARTTKELWQAYQDVYKTHPDWLKAIESYFGKGK